MKDRPDLVADREIVLRLADRLLACYQEFVSSEPGCRRMDGFMGVHNFHCIVIFELERAQQFNPEAARYLRKMAIDTFTDRMWSEPLPGDER